MRFCVTASFGPHVRIFDPVRKNLLLHTGVPLSLRRVNQVDAPKKRRLKLRFFGIFRFHDVPVADPFPGRVDRETRAPGITPFDGIGDYLLTLMSFVRVVLVDNLGVLKFEILGQIRRNKTNDVEFLEII